MRDMQRDARREALNLRIRPQVRKLIDRAAELAGKNRTDFVLDAARRVPRTRYWTARCSQLVLQRIVNSSRLDAPPKPGKRLLKSLQTPAPWE